MVARRAATLLAALVCVTGASCASMMQKTGTASSQDGPTLAGDPTALGIPEDGHVCGAHPPDGAVAMAIAMSDDMQRQLYASSEPERSGQAYENVEVSPETEAWLRVDAALAHARVDAAPLAEPEPVPVETQRIARSERNVPPGELHLEVSNTGEDYRIRVYDNAGRMRHEALDELAVAMRDWRADRARTPHPRLVAMLYRVGQYYDQPLQVISGYRVRGLNATEGSRHGSAEACDIRVEGVGPRELAYYLDSTFAHVGVGYYPTSRFVHLDNRRSSFYWIDRSGPGERSRTRRRDAHDRASSSDDDTLETVHIPESWLYVLPPVYRTYGYED